MMQMQLQRKNKELAEMSQKLERLESQQKERGKLGEDAHAHDHDDDDDDDHDDGCDGASQAIKQKVRRLCRRRANGSLIVPEAVHQAWKNPGPSRDNLIKLYLKNGCQKDPMLYDSFILLKSVEGMYMHVYIYTHIYVYMYICLEWKDNFIREFNTLLEKAKSLELEISGDFHDEDEMKDELKLPECL